jgi:menaquinone-dependent protoporphyrinogen IX oxidase
MKTLIIYKGKYGATQQYAQWIGEELNTPVLLSEDCQWEEMAEADILIIGSSVYIGTLVIKEWIKENQGILSRKKVILFVVCGTPSAEKEKLESFVHSSIPDELRKNITVYFLPGKLSYKKLSLIDKFLLRIGSLLAGRNKSLMTDYNNVKKENVNSLVNDVKAMDAKQTMVA